MLDRTDKPNAIKLAANEKLEGYFATLARQVIEWTKLSKDRFAIGVMGCAEKVGASTVASNVAIALADIEGCSTLLLEADFGCNSLARSEQKNLAGLGDILRSGVAPLSCIRPTTFRQLHVLGSGTLSADEALHLPLHRLSGLIEDLKSEYSIVIVDLPDASEGNCSIPLASQLNGVMLVASADQLDSDRIRRIERRIPVGKLIGLVLNKA